MTRVGGVIAAVDEGEIDLDEAGDVESVKWESQLRRKKGRKGRKRTTEPSDPGLPTRAEPPRDGRCEFP